MKQDEYKRKNIGGSLKAFLDEGVWGGQRRRDREGRGHKAPSLYNHYPSKQAIFEAIVEETAQRYDKFTDKIDIHVDDSGKDIGVFSEIDEAFLFDKVLKDFRLFTARWDDIALSQNDDDRTVPDGGAFKIIH